VDRSAYGGIARLLSHSGPMVRGIYLTLHAQVETSLSPGTVAAAFAAAYAERPLVRLLDQPPELTHAIGGSYALAHACQSDDGREIQVTMAIDNLLKGAAGQAVQAMNLALGLPETAGLSTVGAFPC
jgi:N-acetyl-gamma-glutamyl-phosphate reductase